MENKIEKILCAPIKPKLNNDIILSEIFHDMIIQANHLKIIQMRIGNLWEVIATYYGWLKVKKIDLINLKTKQAIELKNADNTDNSSSRHRNYEKLLEFKKDNEDYEIIYACINCNCSNETDKILDNGIRYVSGKYTLKLLYGEDYQKIIDLIKMILQKKMVLQRKMQHIQIAGKS